ncbi:MAG: TlpA family protein disulfide reductase [Chloroflexi bacterium]|nr:TlpA family protein disulfide reductase [Chloroflexota bacterium]
MEITPPLSTRSSKRTRILVFGAIALIVVGLLGVLALTVRQRAAGALASGAAPDFEIKPFDGETIRLSALRGRPVIVNFWASWCIPCREEAPLLQSTWLKYKDRGLVLIGVDYVDTEVEAKKFMQEFGVTH